MAFQSPKKNPQFADLIAILAQSRNIDSALYQTVQELINRLDKFVSNAVLTVEGIRGATGPPGPPVDLDETFVTSDTEPTLANHRKLTAGANITLDATVANQITIASTGGAGGGIHHLTHEPGGSDAMAVDTAPTVGSLRTLGTGSNQAAPGNDPRLENVWPHQESHWEGGSDALDVKNLAGYPGGTTNFLRADATFASIGPSPSLLETFLTQNAESSLVNSRRLLPGANVVFDTTTPGQLTITSTGSAGLHHTNHYAGAIDELDVTRLGGFPGPSTPQRFLDSEGGFQLVFAATPSVHAFTHQNGGSDEVEIDASQMVTGTINDARIGPPVAKTNVMNTFIEPQEFNFTYPRLFLRNSVDPANAQVFELVNISQAFYVRALSDDLGTVQTIPLACNRLGDIGVGRYIYELGRSVPLGHWTDFTPIFNAGVTIITLYSCKYTLIGKTCIIMFYMHIVVPAGLTNFQLNFPAGIISTDFSGAPFTDSNGYGGMAQTVPSGSGFFFYRDSTGTTIWSTGNHTITSSVAFSIQ